MPASNRQTHVLLPNEVTGYAFDPAHSWWSTIVAEGSTNLVINPSFELLNDVDFVDEYDAAGTWEEVGEENIIVTYPTVGAVAGRRAARLVGATGSGTFSYTEAINVTPGAYTFSLDIYVDDPPARLTMAVMNIGVVVASRTHLISNKGWQRIYLTYTEAATTTRTLRLSYTNTGVHTVTMYTDAWQFERKAYPTTYCLSPATRVPTKRGVLKLDDIKIGDVLVGEDGCRRVFDKWEVEDEAYEIVLDSGVRLIASADHRFSAHKWPWGKKKNPGWKFKPLSEITIGEYLKLHIEPTKMAVAQNPAFAYLVGYLLGDGYFCSRNSRGKPIICWCFGADYAYLANHIQDRYRKALPPSANQIGYPSVKQTSPTELALTTNDQAVARRFAEIGFPQDTGASGKFVPTQVWRWASGDILEFIAGLIDSDGTMDINGNLAIASTSERLIAEVQSLIACTFGVHGRVTHDISNRKHGNRDSYVLRFKLIDAIQLRDLGLHLLHAVKAERLAALIVSNDPNTRGRRRFSKVIGIYPMGRKRLIDITLEDKHDFVAEGVVTHNCDGDMLGFADTRPYSTYYWHGAPHASFSTRLANTGSGGRMISWSDVVGFRTTSIVGLLMAPVEQIVQALGNGKQIHGGMRPITRDFTITGRIFGHNYSQTLGKHNALQHILRPNNTASNDQMVIRYQQVDDDDQLVGLPLEIICVYNDGLQGSITNFYQMAIAVQFTAVQPYLNDIYESTAELALVKELVSNMIVYRDEHGEFFNLGTGTTLGGVVTRVGFLRDGRIVAFGNFTQIAGAGADFGAIWDGANWAEIADTNAAIRDIDDGFKLGYPLTVATADGTVEEYDAILGTWSVLGAGDWLGPIASIVRDVNGDVWIGGDFDTSQTGFTTYNNVARYNYATSAWEVMGDGVVNSVTPANSEVTTVLAPNDGYVYIGGDFTQGESGATTTLANNVIRWNIETEVYEGMSSGLDAAPNQLIQGDDGYIYAVGPFEQNGTATYDLRGFARWNGYSWEEVFPLIRPGGVYGADGVVQDSEGIFWFYNTITDPVDDLFTVEGLGAVPFFGWRNGIFYPPYMADGSIRHLALGPGDRAIHAVDAYVGAGTPTKVPAMTRITYEGSATAPLAVHLQGAGELNQVRNLSTEGGIYGRNTFVMSLFESVVLRNDLQRTLYYSNQRHSLANRLLIGASNMAALRLIPGENRISLFVLDSTADTAGWLSWKNRYWAIGDNG